jgi:hypothetical protein
MVTTEELIETDGSVRLMKIRARIFLSAALLMLVLCAGVNANTIWLNHKLNEYIALRHRSEAGCVTTECFDALEADYDRWNYSYVHAPWYVISDWKQSK